MTEPCDARDVHFAAEAPLARGAVAVALAAVVFGWCFLPQVLGMALGGISLARREPSRGRAWLAIGLSLALTVVWGIALGLVLKWWAASRV